MLQQKQKKTGRLIALAGCLLLLVLVVVLENTLNPQGMFFTVLKKSAVYTLVAVSMNLLNGFTEIGRAHV